MCRSASSQPLKKLLGSQMNICHMEVLEHLSPILSDGTGTAGKHSDVAQGLANTIRQVRPRKFWLGPARRRNPRPSPSR